MRSNHLFDPANYPAVVGENTPGRSAPVNRVLGLRHGSDMPHGRVLILDLDSTLTDTRPWFAGIILSLMSQLAEQLRLPPAEVHAAYADIARKTTLHEYAYLVEAIASRLQAHRNCSFQDIAAAAEDFWQAFGHHHAAIQLYPGVIETLRLVRERHSDMKIIILTDSPDWVAIERLRLVGILHLVDGVVSIRSEEPRLRNFGYRPLIQDTTRRLRGRHQGSEHLSINLSLPAAYCKPSPAGIELILNRLGLPNPELVVICGDRETKEGLAALNWRLSRTLRGLSAESMHYVRALYGQSDYDHPKYAHLASQISSLAISPTPKDFGCSIGADLNCFADLIEAIDYLPACRYRRRAIAS